MIKSLEQKYGGAAYYHGTDESESEDEATPNEKKRSALLASPGDRDDAQGSDGVPDGDSGEDEGGERLASKKREKMQGGSDDKQEEKKKKKRKEKKKWAEEWYDSGDD